MTQLISTLYQFLALDLIGDVHGQDGKLEGLLRHLGYRPAGRGFKAPAGRQAVFVGDLVDRGPGQLRVLEVVRAMVESGDARAVMGNHEFNAIGYVTPDEDRPGEFLRPNRGDSATCLKNRAQHAAFLAQVGEGSAAHRAWVEWFKTLPVWFDQGGVRVVHACWDDAAVATLSAAGWGDNHRLDDAMLAEAHRDGSVVRDARKLLTSGLEMPLPSGRYIEDKQGHRHAAVRIANWRHRATELAQVALVPPGQEEQLKGIAWPEGLALTEPQGSPVFIGHHWFTGTPKIEHAKLCCLDWSAASQGPLVAYRWDGEQELADHKLTWVG